MRFTRSKVSILFSLVSLVAIVSVFAISGAFQGTGAHATASSSSGIR